jgi:hypothetical protein
MDFKEALAAFVAEQTDVYSYVGPIDKTGYDSLCDLLEENKDKQREKVLLVMCTGGGNPNAGYRIARALIHHYGPEKFRLAVPAECKSAGTLVGIGAHGLVVFDRGELGPLDVQFQKQDELFQQSSGLDILRGMTYLKSDALSAFNDYLLDINGGSGLSTKVASEIASKLVMGIYEPMYAQIDPIRLGEMNAALQIAHEYGTRLNEKSKNLKDASLGKLINSYPNHGFVIDRAEARTLFERVDSPKPHEAKFGTFVATSLWGRSKTRSHVMNLCELFESIFKPQGAQNDPGATQEGAEPAQGEAAGGANPEPAAPAAAADDGGQQPAAAGEHGHEAAAA